VTGYRVLHASDAFWRPSNQLQVLNTDLAKQLETSTLGARLWRLAPGQHSTRHHHRDEHELYVVLEGTGRMRVGDDLLTLAPLSAVTVEPDTVRQVFNDTTADALWLVVGAPPEAADTTQMTPELLAQLYPDGPKAPPDTRPVFYFDLASPYAYLASTRVEALLGDVRWQPVLVGAMHRRYRRASWGPTPELRAAGMAEIEARARKYGVPLRWPEPYPADSLIAMRAAVWAARTGAAEAFARAAFEAAFARGEDLTQRAVVDQAASAAGLGVPAVDDPAIKQALRDATDAAITSGVYGVPTVDVGGRLWWGDDRLKAAASAEVA
jgi:2-hydroxychromene-2-carboxylate isomerase/quercetin dioxygenase-like cupin family protein